ncbi:MAG: PTS sugar transporter subunit IIA [Treponema sp.]|nr:PTS sugar transporter subunit IIA [Treponema sp.]
MLLCEVFDERLIKLDLENKTKETVFTELIDAVATVHPELDREVMFTAITARENKMNTSVVSGVAVPHGYYPGTGVVVGAIGISGAGIEYDALDHKPVHCIFLIVMGETSREKHVRVLSRILSLIQSGALSYLRSANSPEEVHTLLSRFN